MYETMIAFQIKQKEDARKLAEESKTVEK
jgi:hypothetical protein